MIGQAFLLVPSSTLGCAPLKALRVCLSPVGASSAAGSPSLWGQPSLSWWAPTMSQVVCFLVKDGALDSVLLFYLDSRVPFSSITINAYGLTGFLVLASFSVPSPWLGEFAAPPCIGPFFSDSSGGLGSLLNWDNVCEALHTELGS